MARPSLRRRPAWLARAGVNIVLTSTLVLAIPAAGARAQDEATTQASSPPAAEPTPTPRPVPLDKPSRPVRVRVPALGIDLPVVSSDRRVAGNPRGYPLCDVAQFLVSRPQELVLPGQQGTSWVYAHAQPGMFLPLVESYFESGADGLTGKLVQLQLRDSRLLTYRVAQVRVDRDYDIAERPNDRQQRLVLQTSTGPTGDYPKLLLAARLIDAEWTDEPRPQPEPRACWQPTPRPTPRGQGDGRRTPVPTPVVAEPTDEPMDLATLAIGSGAVLLGATVVAVYIARRP
jgi:hypothetical protein